MATIIHKNNWRWGRGDIIVIADGRGLCTVSVEDDNPAVAHLSGVSVCESSRRMGLGNELLELSKQHTKNNKEMNPVEDLKAVCAREMEKIGKDNPILVPEAAYNAAVDIAKQNEMSVTIKAVWRIDKRKKL